MFYFVYCEIIYYTLFAITAQIFSLLISCNTMYDILFAPIQFSSVIVKCIYLNYRVFVLLFTESIYLYIGFYVGV